MPSRKSRSKNSLTKKSHARNAEVNATRQELIHELEEQLDRDLKKVLDTAIMNMDPEFLNMPYTLETLLEYLPDPESFFGKYLPQAQALVNSRKDTTTDASNGPNESQMASSSEVSSINIPAQSFMNSNPNNQSKFVRYPMNGELMMSIAGSPLVSNMYNSENVQLSVPTADGKVVAIMPSDAPSPLHMPPLDETTKKNLEKLQKFISKMVCEK